MSMTGTQAIRDLLANEHLIEVTPDAIAHWLCSMCDDLNDQQEGHRTITSDLVPAWTPTILADTLLNGCPMLLKSLRKSFKPVCGKIHE